MSIPIAFTSAAPGGLGLGGGIPPKLEKAFLELRQPPANGGTTNPGPPMGRITFQFNPKELSLTKSAKWVRKTAKDAKTAGPPEFNGAEPSKLTLEIFLDATDTHDGHVVKTVEQLFSCCVPTGESRQQKKSSPPWVIFHWGGLAGFTAYVSQVQVKYTLFTAGGQPIRATCQVSLEEISGETPGQNPTSGALAARRVHRVADGDTVASLAWREYGNPNAWRAIAEANGIDDPTRLRPGTELLLPGADELRESA